MVKIPETYNVGSKENLTQEKLLEMLEDMYETLAKAINQKPNVFIRDDDGQSDDTRLSQGDININRTTKVIEVLTEHDDANTVTWTPI